MKSSRLHLALLSLVLSCSQAPSFERTVSKSASKEADVERKDQDDDQSDDVESNDQDKVIVPDIKKPEMDDVVKKEPEKEPVKHEPDPIMVPPPTPAYDPCPALGQVCTIMPLGDSITYGVNGYGLGGYRVPLIRKAWAANKKITFVGSTQTGQPKLDNKDFPTANEGHSGWTIDDIAGREGLSKIIEDRLKTYKPHIVLLQIGTNDTSVNVDLENIPKRLAKLMDKITATLPDTFLVVAQIVPSRQDPLNNSIKAYNAAIPALVKERADAGKHIVTVDMYNAMTSNNNYKAAYFIDDLHPNDTGFDVMANVWWEAIQKYLK
ncbi:MAG: SGNH/GDSL hydrolase family protein [Bdellovibrionota bacterium]